MFITPTLKGVLDDDAAALPGTSGVEDVPLGELNLTLGPIGRARRRAMPRCPSLKGKTEYPPLLREHHRPRGRVAPSELYRAYVVCRLAQKVLLGVGSP